MTISDPGQQLKMDDCSFIVTGKLKNSFSSKVL